MRPMKLPRKEASARLAKLKGWSIKSGSLHREFEFTDFIHAFAFMTSVALAAEKTDHHPDWSNAYNKVTIDLVTHSVGGLTTNDFDLAAKIQKLAKV